MECMGHKNGWGWCPWVLTGTFTRPHHKFEKKLTAEGQTEAATQVGREMAKLMILLDRLFITTRKEEGQDILPGMEAWMNDVTKFWSPNDCFCTQDMKMAPFKPGEKELLTTLWSKSRVLYGQTPPDDVQR